MDARPLVLAMIGDLFFESRIRALVTQSGGEVVVPTSLRDLADRLGERTPAVVLINLSGRGFNPFAAIADAAATVQVPVVAFGPHKDVVARRRALEAGASRWLPNSKLASTLPSLVSDLAAGKPLSTAGEPDDEDDAE